MTEIERGPYKDNDSVMSWAVDVKYVSHGVPGKATLFFSSCEKAKTIKIGHKFQS